MFARGIVAFAIAMSSSFSVEAAPAKLQGKSVVVTWNESRVQRHVGEANFRPVQASHNMSVYVSSSGRVFSRLTNVTRAGTGASEQVQGQPRETPRYRERVPSFSGQSMTLFQPFQRGGMRRLIVDFDASFSSCTAKVSHAKEAGAQTSLAWSPITKKMVEFQSATTSGENCSVRPGNVFGNE